MAPLPLLSNDSFLMNVRTAQVASTIRRLVQEILSRGLNDPRVTGLVSITKVDVTDDMREARVSLSVMPEDASALTMHGIRHAAGHIQSHVGKALGMRRVPRLSFRVDDSIKKQARLEEAFARAGLAAGSPSPADDRAAGHTMESQEPGPEQ